MGEESDSWVIDLRPISLSIVCNKEYCVIMEGRLELGGYQCAQQGRNKKQNPTLSVGFSH